MFRVILHFVIIAPLYVCSIVTVNSKGLTYISGEIFPKKYFNESAW